jgi:hypothetical protein
MEGQPPVDEQRPSEQVWTILRELLSHALVAVVMLLTMLALSLLNKLVGSLLRPTGLSEALLGAMNLVLVIASTLTFLSFALFSLTVTIRTLFRSFRTALLTVAIYVVLVVATLILRYFVEMTKDSHLHHTILDFLEKAIFLAGTVMVLLVLIVVTVTSAVDLVRSFRNAIAASARAAQSELSMAPQAPGGGSVV